MENLADKMLARLMTITGRKSGAMDISDANLVVKNIMYVIEKHNIDIEKRIYSEINDINHKIKQIKQEIVQNPSAHIPNAARELDAIIKSTENAANKILDSAEKIREITGKLGNSKLIKPVENEIVSIFEACNFQDITGQRIKKVAAAFSYIENAIENILTAFENKNNKTSKKLPKVTLKPAYNYLTGPQFEELAPSQEEIDRLFDSV